ncbi:gp347 [Bacillus phage G]|uniref:Gp347 n=1 Tax=Bacillus phage G TaxID=2884420 RepID=G3MA88_9CAUD|nr:gp347 [Bacillus phage G]AEO93606.1 gp347 [Bacillus phage G]
MKRLTKKANNIDYDQFFDNLLSLNEFNPSEVDIVIQNNTDCLYNGKAYRILYFYNEDIEEITKRHYEDYTKEELVEIVINELIRIDNSYQSFSKSLNGVKYYSDNVGANSHEIGVIISSNIQSGLDIGALHNKLFNSLDYDTQDLYESFEKEEEILAIINNFEIEDSDGIKNFIFEVISR